MRDCFVVIRRPRNDIVFQGEIQIKNRHITHVGFNDFGTLKGTREVAHGTVDLFVYFNKGIVDVSSIGKF